MLAWDQRESEIEEACRGAIRNAQGHSDWRHRRAWTLYNPDDLRLSGLSFQSRLTLVVDKDSDEWKGPCSTTTSETRLHTARSFPNASMSPASLRTFFAFSHRWRGIDQGHDMTTFSDDLTQALTEALAHAKGQGPALIHSPVTPREIRKQAKLTQA